MDYITVSAKNLDDAITEALIQLGVTSDQLDYEVIEKGSAGILGNRLFCLPAYHRHQKASC